MFGFLRYVVLLLLLVYVLKKLLILVWWKPKQIQRRFLDQGVRGPHFWPVIGSLGELAKIYSKAKSGALPPSPSDINPYHYTLQLVFPHLHVWRKKYGRVCLYWYGRSPRLSITDPKLIKEVAANPRKFDQSIQHPLVYNLLGTSLFAAAGDIWATKRKLISPLFLVEYLKELSGLVQSAVENKVEAWHKLLESSDGEVEIDVHKVFESLAQYIIARVIFGDDVDKGLQITQLQSEQADLSGHAVRTFYIPGWRFIPTISNRRSKWLRKEVEKKFKEIISNRRQHKQDGTDWLGFMLSSKSMKPEQILDECCAMLIAGSESTNLLLAWACVLLSIHTKWQDKAREEIHQMLKAKGRDSQLTTDILPHLKILNMIINETLRLYPPIPFVMKKLNEEITVQGLTIPSGTDLEVPIIAVHNDPEQWGDNADQFDPDRFSDGIAKASKHPMAFIPFMQGPRICIGMNFSMVEARITLAMVLNKFRLNISPNYKHEPVCGITLKPANGAQVLFSKI